MMLGQHPFRPKDLCPQVPVCARVISPELPLTMDKDDALRDLLRSLVPANFLRGGSWTEA